MNEYNGQAPIERRLYQNYRYNVQREDKKWKPQEEIKAKIYHASSSGAGFVAPGNFASGGASKNHF